METKKYLLLGGLMGIVLVIATWIIPQFACSDFYRIGSAYPTDHPICYELVVNSRWIEISIILIVLSLIIAWIYGLSRHVAMIK